MPVNTRFPARLDFPRTHPHPSQRGTAESKTYGPGLGTAKVCLVPVWIDRVSLAGTPVVLNQKPDAALEELVRVAAQVDAIGALRSVSGNRLDIDIQVQDPVRNLLDLPGDRDGGAELAGEDTDAAAAAA